MLWQSKLSDKYPVADPSKIFKGTWWKYLDPKFAGRLAYACLDLMIREFKVNSAYRPTSAQEIIYKQFLLGKIDSAAKPGTSWHEFHLAVDTSTYPIRSMTNTQLWKYGLCKPIPTEGWHLQPIETMGEHDRNKWCPINLSELLKEKFTLSDSTINYLEQYQYAESLFTGLLNGKKIFSNQTMEYLQKYPYWKDLKIKLKM